MDGMILLENLCQLKTIKSQIFNGQGIVFDFHAWVNSMEDYFEAFCILEENKMTFARFQLKDQASKWWDWF